MFQQLIGERPLRSRVVQGVAFVTTTASRLSILLQGVSCCNQAISLRTVVSVMAMFRQQSENCVATLEFGLASGDSKGSAQPRSMTCCSVRRARS